LEFPPGFWKSALLLQIFNKPKILHKTSITLSDFLDFNMAGDIKEFARFQNVIGSQ
jgi:hypothetical protein